jgi:hypothetical protein
MSDTPAGRRVARDIALAVVRHLQVGIIEFGLITAGMRGTVPLGADDAWPDWPVASPLPGAGHPERLGAAVPDTDADRWLWEQLRELDGRGWWFAAWRAGERRRMPGDVVRDGTVRDGA